MMPSGKNKLSYLLEQLIKEIEIAIRNPGPSKPNPEEWETSEVWKYVLKQLKLIDSGYQHNQQELAEILISLAKYFDYYSFDWMSDDSKSKIYCLIKKIVKLSIETLNVANTIALSKSCGKHEDKACVPGQLGPRYLKSIRCKFHKSCYLPQKDTCTFLPIPSCTKIELPITIFRIIGSKNKPDGSYWLDSIPNSISDWRSNYAVLSSWNLNHFYVELELPAGTIIWRGKAASQKIPIPGTNCMLQGKGEQIWIPRKTILDLKNKISDLNKTPWHP